MCVTLCELFTVTDSSNASSCLLLKCGGMRSIKDFIWFYKAVICLPENKKKSLYSAFLTSWYIGANPSLHGGFPLWAFGDNLWTDQVAWKGGYRERSESKMIQGPLCSSSIGGSSVCIPNISWETLKENMNLFLDGTVKTRSYTYCVILYVHFFSRWCLAEACDHEWLKWMLRVHTSHPASHSSMHRAPLGPQNKKHWHLVPHENFSFASDLAVKNIL